MFPLDLGWCFSLLYHTFPPFYSPLFTLTPTSVFTDCSMLSAMEPCYYPKELAGESSDSPSPPSLLKSFHQHYECPDTQSGHMTCPSLTVGSRQTGLADLQSRAPLAPLTALFPLGTSLRRLSPNPAPACLPARRRPAARACGTPAPPAFLSHAHRWWRSQPRQRAQREEGGILVLSR